MPKILEATEKTELDGTEGLAVETPAVSTAQYATVNRLDDGRAGGRTIEGGSAANEDLTFDATSDATKGDVLINTTGGKVGIGTAAPGETLHISSATANNGRIRLEETGTGGSNGPGLTIYNEGGFEGGIFFVETSDTFEIFTGGSGSVPQISIDASTNGGDVFIRGNVGISTASPDSRLDIADGGITFSEMTAPSAPAANGCVLFLEDNGAGKTRLMALFNTGLAQEVSIQP